MRNRPIFFVLVSLFASACMSIPNPTRPAKLPSSALSAPDTGVVILSAGAPGRCLTNPIAMRLTQEGGGKGANRVPMIPVDGTPGKSDFKDHPGSLSALRLPAGTYNLYPWAVSPLVTTTKRPTFVFDVRAGETTYVGEVFIARSCSSSMLFQVRDQYDRDVPMAIEQNAALGTRPVVKRLMQTRPEEES